MGAMVHCCCPASRESDVASPEKDQRSTSKYGFYQMFLVLHHCKLKKIIKLKHCRSEAICISPNPMKLPLVLVEKVVECQYFHDSTCTEIPTLDLCLGDPTSYMGC